MFEIITAAKPLLFREPSSSGNWWGGWLQAAKDKVGIIVTVLLCNINVYRTVSNV